MKKKTMALVSSCAAIAVCSSLIVGSTYALFTSDSKVDITVKSGKVDVVATLDRTYNEGLGYEVKSTLDEAYVKPEFVEDDNLKLNNIVPGDSVTVKIDVVNNSTVTVKYRANVVIKDLDDGSLSKVLEVTSKVNSESEGEGISYDGNWRELAASTNPNGDKLGSVYVTVALPEEVKTNMNESCTISFAVEAVQGNAEVVNDVYVDDLKDYFPDAKLGYGDSADKAIVLQPKDGEKLYVRNWQDIWVNADLTVQNITFLQGLSVSNRNSSEKILTVKGCEIFACNQENLRSKVEENSNFRISNSGDGLCLGIDSSEPEYSNFNVVIENCTMNGDGGENVDRDGYKDADAIKANNRNKARGYGISLGTAAGKMYANSVVIDNCTINNTRGNAIQVYACRYDLTIKNNTINGWGNNDEKRDSAIRGDIAEKSNIVITDNYFGLDETNAIRHVNIDYYNNNTDGTRVKGTY